MAKRDLGLGRSMHVETIGWGSPEEEGRAPEKRARPDPDQYVTVCDDDSAWLFRPRDVVIALELSGGRCRIVFNENAAVRRDGLITRRYLDVRGPRRAWLKKLGLPDKIPPLLLLDPEDVVDCEEDGDMLKRSWT